MFFFALIYLIIGVAITESTKYESPLDNVTYIGEVLTWFPDLIIYIFNK